MKRPDFQADLHRLRTRAERQQLVASAPTSPADAQRLVQELQVHQIELEMQYEELRLAQADAEASHARYADLYDFAPVGYCTLAPDGRLALLNLRTAQLLGTVRQQLTGRPLAPYVAPAERPAFAAFLAGLWAAPGQRHTCELAMRRADDTPFFAYLTGEVVLAAPDAPEPPAACRLVLADVTDRRRAAEALAASEARFRATFEQSHDGNLLLRDLRLVDANAAALDLLGPAGADKARVLGRHLGEFWPEAQPDGRRLADTLADCTRQARARGWDRCEWCRSPAPGQMVWDELSFYPVVVQGEPLLHVALRDITDRKRGEQRLQESEARLSLALEASQTGIISWDFAHGQVAWDARAQAVFGRAFDPAPVPVATLGAQLHPDDAPRVRAAAGAALTDGSPLAVDCRVVWQDGSVHHVSSAGRAVIDGHGQMTSFIGVLRDVTALHTAEEELTHKNFLLGHILQNLPVVLTRFGPDGRYRGLTGAGLSRLGLADGALVGQLAAEVFPSEAASIRRLLAGQGDSHVAVLGTAGAPAHFLTHSFWDPVHQEGVRFSIDITESERLKEEAAGQQQRQQREVLAAILTTQEEERRRTAEALHNGVGQLLYATRLHLDGLPPSEEVQAALGLLNEAIRATRTLSSELTPSVLEDFGLPTALRELTKRIPAARLAVDLNLHRLDEPLPALLATAVYRVVQELLNNVMKHSRAREVFVQVAREDHELHLSVEDSGVGFDADAPATRSGLGLASIRTRVSLLGGTLTIRARPSHGTGVFLVLPVT